jgi:hypothetical protein
MLSTCVLCNVHTDLVLLIVHVPTGRPSILYCILSPGQLHIFGKDHADYWREYSDDYRSHHELVPI